MNKNILMLLMGLCFLQVTAPGVFGEDYGGYYGGYDDSYGCYNGYGESIVCPTCQIYRYGGCGRPSPDHDDDYVNEVITNCHCETVVFPNGDIGSRAVLNDVCSYDVGYAGYCVEGTKKDIDECGGCSGSMLIYNTAGQTGGCSSVTGSAATPCADYYECSSNDMRSCSQCFGENGERCSSTDTKVCFYQAPDLAPGTTQMATARKPCRNPCFVYGSEGQRCEAGVAEECGACLRTSRKDGVQCCVKWDTKREQIIQRFIGEDCGSFEVGNYAYCHEGTCQHNSFPYIDTSAEQTSRPIKIAGNPERMKSDLGEWIDHFPLIYYKNIPNWSGYESDGVMTQFIDGGKLYGDSFEYGHNEPDPDNKCAEQCRLETPAASLSCQLKDPEYKSDVAVPWHRKEFLNTNGSCQELKLTPALFDQIDLTKDIPVADVINCSEWDLEKYREDESFVCKAGIPDQEDGLAAGHGHSPLCAAKDNGLIEGQCTGENIRKTSRGCGFDICPGGTRDLDNIAYSGKVTAWALFKTILMASVSLDISPIKVTIDPHDDFCGFVESEGRLKAFLEKGVWGSIKKEAAKKLKKEGLSLDELLQGEFLSLALSSASMSVEHVIAPETEAAHPEKKLTDPKAVLQEIYKYSVEDLDAEASVSNVDNKSEQKVTISYIYERKKEPWGTTTIHLKEPRKAIFTVVIFSTKNETIRGIDTTAKNMSAAEQIFVSKTTGVFNPSGWLTTYHPGTFDPFWFGRAPQSFSYSCCQNAWVDLMATSIQMGVDTDEIIDIIDGEAGLSISGMSTYFVENENGERSDAYYINQVDTRLPKILFNRPVEVKLKYDKVSMPSETRPRLYKLEDDFVSEKSLQSEDEDGVVCSVSPAGEACFSSDGNLRVIFPPGAVDETTEIMIAKRNLMGEGWETQIECHDNGATYPAGTKYCSEDQRYVMQDYVLPLCFHPGTESSYISEIRTSVVEEICGLEQICQESTKTCATPSACLQDTDGGSVSETKGYVETPQGNISDACLDNGTLLEYVCENGQVKGHGITCDQACREGTCQNYLADLNRDGTISLEEILEYAEFNNLPEDDPDYVNSYTVHTAIKEYEAQGDLSE